MRTVTRRTDSRHTSSAILGVALFLALLADAAAQSALDSLRQHEQELEATRTEQKKAAETTARLRDEIDAIGVDRRKLNQALIDTAARLRDVEARIAEAEDRLRPL